MLRGLLASARPARAMVIAAALGAAACDPPYVEELPSTDDAGETSRVAEPPSPPPRPVVVAEPPPPPPPLPPPPPPFDAEAEARAREARERAAFEAEWPLSGICYHFLGQVHARPDASSRIVGYMRRGAVFRARAPLAGPGCARGWSEVPGNGYVCRGDGFLVGEGPQTFEPSPVQPALDDALPYAYAYVAREDAPQYWRLPSTAEENEASAVLSRLRDATAAAIAAQTAAAGDADAAEPDLEAPPGLAPDPGTETEVAAEPADAGVALVATGSEVPTLPAWLRMRMLRGFYVSVDREETDGARRFYRTIRGTYVPAEVMAPAEPPAMRGVVLGGAWRPPIAFVYRRGARSLTRDPVTGALSQGEPLEYHVPLVLEDEIVERRGNRHRVARRGFLVRESVLRVVEPIARPTGVPAEDRWIHVDLSDQTLVAYEGDTPVFATLVSTGRAGFATPVGTYRIQSKHVSTTMDDPDSLTEAYSIEDVPWTMYFEGSYALHAAFWHDSFGHTRSHGCVNLAPADARWIFQWSTPALPPGWHGVIATPRRPGTWVHITE